MQKTLLVGIAGGSGSGKSTLAVALCKSHPNQYALVHLDDYFKKQADVPKLHGLINWESPDAIRYDDLYRDLLLLADSRSITVRTKSELYHPSYDHDAGNKIEQIIEPKPIILVEGYMALYDSRIRELFDLKIFLDMDLWRSSQRRSSNKWPIDKEYFEKLLAPFHKELVEPTKCYADLVIDVTTKSAEEVVDIVKQSISTFHLPNDALAVPTAPQNVSNKTRTTPPVAPGEVA